MHGLLLYPILCPEYTMHLAFGHDETYGIGDGIDYEEFNWEGIGEGLFDIFARFDHGHYSRARMRCMRYRTVVSEVE
jgi:hypothetical protein